ncbi:MAG: ABC-type transport system, ATPase component, partial [Nitrospira sp.]|nr:ABC-type transport system, ATPase component [Nitrospira sp.]
AAMQDPAVRSNANELQERSHVLQAAQADVERLYARWAELEERRAETVPGS